MNGLKKNKKRGERIKKLIFEIVFPKFWPLDAGILQIWPQIRILRQKSCLEPAGKLANLSSRPKNGQINFLICFFINPIGRLNFEVWVKDFKVFEQVFGQGFDQDLGEWKTQ